MFRPESYSQPVWHQQGRPIPLVTDARDRFAVMRKAAAVGVGRADDSELIIEHPCLRVHIGVIGARWVQIGDTHLPAACRPKSGDKLSAAVTHLWQVADAVMRYEDGEMIDSCERSYQCATHIQPCR